MTITIDGTTGIASVDGSAGSPSVRGSDANSGIVYDADTVAISTGGTSRVTVDSSGKVGVGITSPTVNAQIQSSGTNSLLKLAGTTSGSGINDGLDVGINGSDGILWNRENGPIQFATNNSERMRLSSDGKLGINQTGATKQLHVVGPGSATNEIIAKFKGGSGNDCSAKIGLVAGYSDTANDLEGHVFIGAKRSGSGNTAHLTFETYNGSAVGERARITNNGKFLIGKDTDSLTHQAGLIIHANANICYAGDGSGDHDFAEYYRGTSGSYSRVGYIRTNGSSTTYSTSSDYRLKENEVPISDGITRLKTLKPYRFNFKSDPDTTVDGFFAHEVTAVPEATTGKKDEMKSLYYEEGDTIPSEKKVGDFKEFSTTEISPQGIDQSKLVPLLTAALQEAITKIETLETKVAALEAA